MTTIITFDGYITHGTSEIDLVHGQVTNEETKAVQNFDGFDKYVKDGKGRFLTIFADADLSIRFNQGTFEHDMNSFTKAVKKIELETFKLDLETTFAPDQVHVIIVASDDPDVEIESLDGIPHSYYSNSVTAIGAEYTNLFFRHTVGRKNKIKVFNGNGGDINLDIQHRENPESDSNDQWVSYEGYPKVIAAGDTEVFGDDALLDTTHHFHRVRVQATGANSPVKGAMLTI